jgi:hypothetical protein
MEPLTFGDSFEAAAEVTMRFRIHGRDEASQSPIESFFLDAADEEEARSRASELGTVIDSVEVVPQKDEAIQPHAEPAMPSQTVAPPAARHPSAGSARPWARRTWLLVCLVLVLVSLAGGIGIGIVLPRVSPLGPRTSTSSPGVRLEELKAAEELFALAGQEAVVVKYSGGDVEFWVETESQGKKEKHGPVRALAGLLGGDEKPPAPNQTVEGYFLWVRSEADEAGRELWRLACRRDLVATEKSGLQVSAPLVEASASQSREDRRSSSMFTSSPVRVWRGKKPRGTGYATKSTFPGPLPTNREVCLKEIHVTGYRRDEWVALSANTIGMLGTASGQGPLLTAAALTPGRVDAPVEEHTIKVMCRATPDQGKGANGQPARK